MRKAHQGRVDKNGNFRDRSRKDDGYLESSSNIHALPFPALVTAWYPSSQTIDVNVPGRYGQTVIEGISVYGNFFEATGVIQSPKARKQDPVI